MLMEPIAQYNDLSDDLRKELDKKIESFGDIVRYRFNIANQNPDPQNYNGKIVYPRQYTLDPAKFTIRDEKEKRPAKSKIKNIAIVSGLDDKGLPNKFEKIKLFGNEKGVLELRLAKREEDRAKCLFLELHPKLEGGMFADPDSYKIFSRIDERAYAKEQREIRATRMKAFSIAQEMSDEQIMQFNSGMSWDESRDIEIIRQEVETFSENEPDVFIKLTEGKDMAYRAVVQTALSKQKIVFDPAEYKFTDNTTKQVMVILSPVANKTHVEMLAQWLQGNGEKGDKIYNRLKEMIK